MTFEPTDRLSRSLVLSVTAYYLIQQALFLLFAIPGGFRTDYFRPFIIVSTIFHALLGVLLILFKNDFVIEKTGKRLDRINIANRITLFRISTLPTMLFLVIAARKHSIRYPLLALVVLVFITDFVDGYVSRKANQVTRVGRMMDSTSDYTLLVVLTTVFHYYRLIPVWIFVLVILRLGLQTILVGILFAVNRRIETKSTFMGKLAVASIMILYSVEVLKLVSETVPVVVLTATEIVTGCVLAASMADKLLAFRHSLSERGESVSPSR